MNAPIPRSDEVPRELTERHFWVNWRPVLKPSGKLDKVPWSAVRNEPTSATDQSNWMSFIAAAKRARRYGLGVGLVLSKGDPYAGLDLDGCFIADDELHPAARALASELLGKTYAEVTPSNNGLRLLVRHHKNGGRSVNQHAEWGGKFEFYDSGRMFTVTGWGFEDAPLEIGAFPTEITRIEVAALGNPSEARTGLGTGLTGVVAAGEASPLVPETRRHDAIRHYGEWQRREFGLDERQLVTQMKWFRTHRCEPGLKREVSDEEVRSMAKWVFEQIEVNAPLAEALRRLELGEQAKAEHERRKFDTAMAQAGEAEPLVRRVLSRFRRDPLKELPEPMSDQAVRRLPPPPTLIEGHLRLQGYNNLYGQPGVAKTLLALEWSRCVRTGVDWYGWRVERGPVLYLAGEGVEDLGVREQALDQRYPLSGAEPIQFVPDTWDVTTPEGLTFLTRLVWRLQPKLVVVDPTGEYTGRSDGVEDTEPLARAARALAMEAVCAVLLLHHTEASGSRARGTDHLRQWSLVHTKLEGNERNTAEVNYVQEKIRSGPRLAARLRKVGTDEGGVYLEMDEGRKGQRFDAGEYQRLKVERKEIAKQDERVARARDPKLWRELLKRMPGSVADAKAQRYSQNKAIAGIMGGREQKIEALRVLSADGYVESQDWRGGLVYWKVREVA